jgi:transcriptional regulator with XRE-family HTH domain
MQSKRTSPSAISVEHITLGRAVREIRARRDLSQEQFGFRGGLHRNYVGAIERGEINPTFRRMLSLAIGLSVPLSELIALYERRRPDHIAETVRIGEAHRSVP